MDNDIIRVNHYKYYIHLQSYHKPKKICSGISLKQTPFGLKILSVLENSLLYRENLRKIQNAV